MRRPPVVKPGLIYAEPTRERICLKPAAMIFPWSHRFFIWRSEFADRILYTISDSFEVTTIATLIRKKTPSHAGHWFKLT